MIMTKDEEYYVDDLDNNYENITITAMSINMKMVIIKI